MNNKIGKVAMWRKCVQFCATLFSNLEVRNIFVGELYRGKMKGVCVPGLNCYSCPAAIGSCPLGALQSTFVRLKNSANAYIFGMLLAISVLFGRFTCGWLCPFGLLQELLYKIPTKKYYPKIKKVAWIKYVILVVFVFLIPLLAMTTTGVGYPAFCKYICPQGTLAGLMMAPVNETVRKLMGVHFIWKLILLIAMLISSIFVFRPFCRIICPLGAIYGIFNAFALIQIHVDKPKCIDCGRCKKVCPIELNPIKQCNHAECIRCGKCMDECSQKAIRYGILDL